MVGLRAGTNANLGHIIEQAGLGDELGELAFQSEIEQEDDYTMNKIIEASKLPGESALHRRLRIWRKSLKEKTKFHKELVVNGKALEGVIVKRGEKVEVWKSHPFPIARDIVMHKSFETAMAILILSNCMVIGWQAELRHPEGAVKAINMLLEHVFTLAFLVELVLRSLVYNWTFWFDKENHLDIFLVFLSILNSWILTPFNIKADFLRKATVLRILRLVRIARNFKRQFKEMWQLLRGLVDSFETLFWTYVMMLALLYFFAITATTLFGKMGAFDADPGAKKIAEDNFGDVMMSMLTLFQIMTLDSWTSIARPLMAVQVWSIFFFIIFITVSNILLMNLITSVIVTQAFEHSKEDKEEMQADLEAERAEALHQLKEMFQEMDEDEGGTLSREEVAKSWKNRKVRQKFRTMDIGKKDLVILWTALDDGDGELTIEEFTRGIKKLKGEAKAKDILKLYREVRVLESSIKEITILADYSKDRMNNIRMKLRTTFREIEATRRTLGRIKETARLASKAQPLCV